MNKLRKEFEMSMEVKIYFIKLDQLLRVNEFFSVEEFLETTLHKLNKNFNNTLKLFNV